jgi:hypothetical protein
MRSAALSARARQLTPQARERGRLDAPARCSGAQRAGGCRRPTAATARTARAANSGAIAPTPHTDSSISSAESRWRGSSRTTHGHDSRRWRGGLGRTVKLAIARLRRTALRLKRTALGLRRSSAPTSLRALWLSPRPRGDVGRAAGSGPDSGRRRELARRADAHRSAPCSLAGRPLELLRCTGPAARRLSRPDRRAGPSTSAQVRPPHG